MRDAVHVDDETAVLVNSKQSGQQRLVVEKGLFFPDRYDEIVEVRKLVRVAPHEVAIARDNAGAFHFYSGAGGAEDATGGGTAFFLQPHHELVTMMWSSGSSADDVKNNVVKKVPLTLTLTLVRDPNPNPNPNPIPNPDPNADDLTSPKSPQS